MATHSSILAWRIQRKEGPTVHGGHKESEKTEGLMLSTFLLHISINFFEKFWTVLYFTVSHRDCITHRFNHLMIIQLSLCRFPSDNTFIRRYKGEKTEIKRGKFNLSSISPQSYLWLHSTPPIKEDLTTYCYRKFACGLNRINWKQKQAQNKETTLSWTFTSSGFL